MANPKLTITLSAKDDVSKQIDQVKKSFENIKNSGASVRQQLRALQQNLAEMNAAGLNTSSIFTEMSEYAGQLADAMGDARQAVNAFADDQFKLEAMGQAMSLGVNIGTTLAGTLDMLGVKNESMAAAIKKVQAAMTLLNGVQQVANLLNKDSALMLRIKQIQLRANAASTTQDTAATTGNTVATGANTVATQAATVAKNNLNKAVAIGKAIMGDWTGIVLLAGAALTSYALFSNDATDKIEEQTDALKTAKNMMQEYKDKVTESAGAAIGKFKALQTQWNLLKDTASKTKWIEDNQSAFKNLGLSIKSVTDAENAFVNNSENVVAALKARAEAAAATSLLEDAYKEKWEKDQQFQKKGQYSVISKDDPLFAQMQRMGYIKDTGIKSNGGQYRYRLSSQEAAQYYNAQTQFKNELEFQDKIEFLEDKISSATNKLSSLDTGNLFSGDTDTPKASKTTVTKPEKEEKVYDETSIKYAAQMVANLRTELEEAPEGMRPGIRKQLDYWETELKRRKNDIEIEVSIDTDVTSKLKELPETIKPLTDIKDTALDAAEGMEALGNAVNTLGGAMQNLSKDNEGLAKAAAVTQAIGSLVLSFAQAMSKESNIWTWIAGGVAGIATLTSLVAQLQSFDQGGIVAGSSYIGDKTLVRANAGEMILNQRQQNNLYKAIKNDQLGAGNAMRGNVTFRIAGTDLVGVINNYNNKQKRQS